MYSAQKISSHLDQKNPRNLDYVLIVNILTSLTLLKIAKPHEALSFINIAEKTTDKLMETMVLNPMGLGSLNEIVGESANFTAGFPKTTSASKTID